MAASSVGAGMEGYCWPSMSINGIGDCDPEPVIILLSKSSPPYLWRFVVLGLYFQVMEHLWPIYQAKAAKPIAIRSI